MIFIGVIAALLILDLGLKKMIEEQDAEKFPREMEGTGGKIWLYQNHNQGFPFGFLKSKPQLVRNIPLVMTSALAGILVWLLPRKGNTAEKLALSLCIGGAASNLYDRLIRHYVVDYFSIQCKWLKKVVFNLGDIFILAGAGLLFFSEIVRSLNEAGH